jgi:hypothetical protein
MVFHFVSQRFLFQKRGSSELKGGSGQHSGSLSGIANDGYVCFSSSIFPLLENMHAKLSLLLQRKEGMAGTLTWSSYSRSSFERLIVTLHKNDRSYVDLDFLEVDALRDDEDQRGNFIQWEYY